MTDSKFRKVSGRWQEVILICRKCSKKLDGGFGPKGRTRLNAFLREGLATGKGRKARMGLVMAPCFKLCPKAAVTVTLGSKPQILHVIPRRAEVGEITEALGLGDPEPASVLPKHLPFS
jgi:hypothetical protein